MRIVFNVYDPNGQVKGTFVHAADARKYCDIKNLQRLPGAPRWRYYAVVL